MEVWLGTYESKTKTGGEDCFIVWAPSKEEANECVRLKTEKPFEKHLRPLLKAGFLNIHVGFKSDQMILTPPKEAVESGVWIYMDEFE